MSLAEADFGVKNVLKMGEVIPAPVIMRAFQAAKGVNKSGAANDDFVELSEFRIFLLYLRQYLELWVMFDAIDTSKDKLIEEKEFSAAVEMVEKWGLKVEDPAKMFKEIDADGSGKVMFDEFAHWAIHRKLDLEDDDDAPDAGTGSGLIEKAGSAVRPKSAKAKEVQKKKATPTKKQVDWAEVAKKLPWGEDAKVFRVSPVRYTELVLVGETRSNRPFQAV